MMHVILFEKSVQQVRYMFKQPRVHEHVQEEKQGRGGAG